MMDWLRDYKLPASAVVGICGAFAAAFFYLHGNFVSAAKFGDYQNQVERRILVEKRQALEADILRLDVKRRSLPRQFTPVDAAVLDKLTKDLARVEADLRKLQEKEGK